VKSDPIRAGGRAEVARIKACYRRGHGPFYIAALSTADSGPAPAIHCLSCLADCSPRFVIVKLDGMIEITNAAESPATFHPFYGLDQVIAAGGSAIYSHGRFFRTRIAAQLSLSQGENDHDRHIEH
jgi:hypothetical protein